MSKSIGKMKDSSRKRRMIRARAGSASRNRNFEIDWKRNGKEMERGGWLRQQMTNMWRQETKVNNKLMRRAGEKHAKLSGAEERQGFGSETQWTNEQEGNEWRKEEPVARDSGQIETETSQKDRPIRDDGQRMKTQKKTQKKDDEKDDRDERKANEKTRRIELILMK